MKAFERFRPFFVLCGKMPPAARAAVVWALAVALLTVASGGVAAEGGRGTGAGAGYPSVLRDSGQPTANYLQFVKNGYKPSGRRSRGAPSPALHQNSVDGRGAVTGVTTAGSGLAAHVPVLPPQYFLTNQTSVGGFRYEVDTQLAELLALIDGRCGFEIPNSEQLSPKLLQDHVFMKSAALFKRSRDGLGSCWLFLHIVSGIWGPSLMLVALRAVARYFPSFRTDAPQPPTGRIGASPSECSKWHKDRAVWA